MMRPTIGSGFDARQVNPAPRSRPVPQLGFARADDDLWAYPGGEISEREIEREMLMYLDLAEGSDLVHVEVEFEPSGARLVVRGHNPVYPSCRGHNPGRYCGDSDQPHKMHEWVSIPVSEPPGGHEPDEDRVVGDTDSVIAAAQDGADRQDHRMRNEMKRTYLEYVLPGLPDVLNRWWAEKPRPADVTGREPLLSEDDIYDLASHMVGLCTWAGKTSQGFPFDAHDPFAPSYYDVLVALGDMDSDYPVFYLEFGWLGRDFSWFDLDTVDVVFKD